MTRRWAACALLVTFGSVPLAHAQTAADKATAEALKPWYMHRCKRPCYDDEYLRTRAGWRIHGRALTINAIETRPVRRLRGQP